VLFAGLRAPRLIKRIVLTDGSKGRRFLQDFLEIEFLPLRRQLRNGLEFVARRCRRTRGPAEGGCHRKAGSACEYFTS
jgi:hypothetical protein